MRNLVLKDPVLISGSGDAALVSENIRLAWRQVRAPIVVPLLQAAVYVCAAMSLMLFVERVYMAAVILCVKVLRRKRYTKYKLDAMKQELEASNSHPMVLVQIPMYNEKEVYRLSIGAACGLSWPSDKIIIQVLDDSTDMILRRVSVWKKFHVIYAFFFVRKIVAHFVTSIFYCIVIPACVLVPEVHLPKFIAIYVPSTITVLNAVCTPRSLHLLLFWILFENVMSVHRAKATIIGLLEANRVNEWVVTEKLGTTGKPKPNTKLGRPRSRIGERIHVLELFMGLYLFYCAIYNIMFSHDHFYVYLLFQAGAFFIMGFGCVGTFVSN